MKLNYKNHWNKATHRSKSTDKCCLTPRKYRSKCQHQKKSHLIHHCWHRWHHTTNRWLTKNHQSNRNELFFDILCEFGKSKRRNYLISPTNISDGDVLRPMTRPIDTKPMQINGNDWAKPREIQIIVSGIVIIKMVFRRPNLSEQKPLNKSPIGLAAWTKLATKVFMGTKNYSQSIVMNHFAEVVRQFDCSLRLLNEKPIFFGWKCTPRLHKDLIFNTYFTAVLKLTAAKCILLYIKEELTQPWCLCSSHMNSFVWIQFRTDSNQWRDDNCWKSAKFTQINRHQIDCSGH